MAQELSPREREALDHIASGQTSKEIASELSIAESTVNWHVSNARTKLGAATRAEAVALAMDARRPLDRTEVMRRPPSVRPWRQAWFVSAVAAVAFIFGAGLVAGAAYRGSSHEPATSPPSRVIDATPAPTNPVAPSTGGTASPAPSGGPPTERAPSDRQETTPFPSLGPVAPSTLPTPLAVPTSAAPSLSIPTVPPLPSLPRP